MNTLLNSMLTKYKGKLPEAYITAIVDLAENDIDRRFLNDSDVHASLLIDCMIGESVETDEIRIYSGTLRAECFEDVLRASKNHKIRILVEEYPKAIKVLESLSLGPTDMTHIELLSVAEKSNNHFYTVGEKHFRFETNHERASAVANFNEPETVAKLNARFDEMWESAKLVQAASTQAVSTHP